MECTHRLRVLVDPERDPGQHDDEDGRDVGLQHKVAHSPLEVELGQQARVVTCSTSVVNYSTSVVNYSTSSYLQHMSS